MLCNILLDQAPKMNDFFVFPVIILRNCSFEEAIPSFFEFTSKTLGIANQLLQYSTTKADKARIFSCTGIYNGAWLYVAPIASLGLAIDAILER
jgi:hypothetical protein